MENKLQELTNKLYEEGLVKGRAQAEELMRKAQEEALAIVENAKKEAAAILDKAQKDAAEHKEQVDNEIQMASRQSVSVLKQKVEDLLVFKSLEKPTQDAVADANFIQEVIKTLVGAFNPKGATTMDLEVMLPQQMKDQFTVFLKTQLSNLFNSNLTIAFSSDVENGFRIAPKDGGYQIRFSDKDFVALFSQYLRPKTKALIYGE